MKAVRASKLRSPEKKTVTKTQRPGAPRTPRQISRILVPVDFSQHSQFALHYALRLAAKFDAEVALVHIVEQTVYPGDWMYPPLAMSDFAVEKQDRLLERLRDLGADAKIKTRHIVRIGRAWREIIEIAKEEKSDLIVVATRGYTGLKHVLLGSVAEKIIRHAHCPVLVVRPEDNDDS